MTEVAKVYGGSLYDLAAAEGLDERILTQLDTVCALMKQEPEYLRLLSTPSIPKQERCGLLQEAFGAQAEPYLLNFMKILCENGSLGQLFGCAQEYRDRYNAQHGIMPALAVSALPLTAAQKKALTGTLEQMTGKRVDLSCRVDPQVLGGLRLELGGVQLDGTVESRLAAVKAAIEQAVL